MPSELYTRFLECGHAAITLSNVQPGSMYFGLKRYQPYTRTRRLYWMLWSLIERRARGLLSLLDRLTRNYPPESAIRKNLARSINGGAYALDALKVGAKYAVVDPSFKSRDPRVIVVEDVAKTLRALALEHRQSLDLPVIAITGSSGKSTTVKLLYDMLNEHFNCCPPAEFNGGDEFPLGPLNIRADCDVAVFEVATVFPQMIAANCETLLPTHGLITHIGEAHAQTLPGIETVQRAKWELFDHLMAHHGKTYLNMDDPWLATQRSKLSHPWLFGRTPECDTRVDIIKADPFLQVQLYPESGSEPPQIIQTQLAGAFNLGNIQAAVAVARSLRVPDHKIIAALKSFQPPPDRSQILEWGTNTVFNDSVHNTITGLQTSLASFMDFSTGQRLLIVGDIPDLHVFPERVREQVAWVEAQDVQHTVFVGPDFYKARRPGPSVFLKSMRDYRRWLSTLQVEDTWIFVKGGSHLQLMEPLRGREA